MKSRKDETEQLTHLIDEYAKAINQNILERFFCSASPSGKEFFVQLASVPDLEAIKQNLMIWIRFHLAGATINTSPDKKNVFSVVL